MSFGTPTRRARMPAAAMDELPEPPTAAAPSRRPSACSRASTAAAPRPMASTAAPRSATRTSSAWSAPAARPPGGAPPRRARDLLAAHVRLDLRLTQHPGVHQHDVDAGLAQAVAQEAVLDALRVQRPDEYDRGHQ